MRYAIIMAGGAGTRLWPMSRKDRPKQLLPFIHGSSTDAAPQSLLAIAAARLEGLIPDPQRFIVTAENYRDPIRRDLPSFTDDRIVGEPMGRDTVNAVGLAGLPSTITFDPLTGCADPVTATEQAADMLGAHTGGMGRGGRSGEGNGLVSSLSPSRWIRSRRRSAA